MGVQPNLLLRRSSEFWVSFWWWVDCVGTGYMPRVCPSLFYLLWFWPSFIGPMDRSHSDHRRSFFLEEIVAYAAVDLVFLWYVITFLRTFKMVKLVRFRCSNLYIWHHLKMFSKNAEMTGSMFTSCHKRACRNGHSVTVRASPFPVTLANPQFITLLAKSLPEVDTHVTFMNKF